jgi:hypothetical protein
MSARSHDRSQVTLLRALRRYDLSAARVLAPHELASRLPNFVPYGYSFRRGIEGALDVVVVHLDRLNMLDGRLLVALRDRFHCHFANAQFLVFHRDDIGYDPPDPTRLNALWRRTEEIRHALRSDRGGYRLPRRRRGRADPRRAVVVTTYDRPARLQRSLPQIAGLGLPTVVIDDGSSESARDANAYTCRDVGAFYVCLPENRGLATALNIGLAYALADPAVEWVSYFQDDVDVRPDTIDHLAALEDPARRPILTGYDADEHPVTRERIIAGLCVKLKASTPAVHMHCHADFWRAIMPIPSRYLGAPKPARGASGEDWWITHDAPGAARRRGVLVTCVPGLVRTFVWHPDDSTWGTANLPDPPLAPPDRRR